MTRRMTSMHTHGRRLRISSARDLIAALMCTAALGFTAVLATGCDNAGDEGPEVPTTPSPPPTSPPPPTTGPQLTGITVDPGGVGIPHATMFNFGLTGQTGTDSTIAWTSDNGGVNANGATASHMFTQAGTFTVRAEARNSAGTSAVTRAVEVKGVTGMWDGTVTDHVPPATRQVPIRSFTLRIDSVPTRNPIPIVAHWSDNAGCQHTTIVAAVGAPRQVDISMEQLPCNDRDFSLNGTMDGTGNVIEGRCTNGGPNCAFRMTRR